MTYNSRPAITIERRAARGIGAGDNCPHPQGRAEQGSRLAAVDGLERLGGAVGASLGLEVGHLAPDHPRRARAVSDWSPRACEAGRV